MRMIEFRNVEPATYACVEALNTLASNIIFSGSEYRSIMITSCNEAEGKSFISFNLARSLGNLGFRTLCLDADLRKSVFISHYDIQFPEPRMGIVHYLAGYCSMEDVVYQTNLKNLWFVPVGKDVVNSLPLLTTSRFMHMLKELRNGFDFVIIDTPPIGVLIDAAMIASDCDASVLVVSSDMVSRHEVLECERQLSKTGCPILGVVLNMVALDTRQNRKYYKRYYSKQYKKYVADHDASEEKSAGLDHGDMPGRADKPRADRRPKTTEAP